MIMDNNTTSTQIDQSESCPLLRNPSLCQTGSCDCHLGWLANLQDVIAASGWVMAVTWVTPPNSVTTHYYTLLHITTTHISDITTWILEPFVVTVIFSILSSLSSFCVGWTGISLRRGAVKIPLGHCRVALQYWPGRLGQKQPSSCKLFQIQWFGKKSESSITPNILYAARSDCRATPWAQLPVMISVQPPLIKVCKQH